MSLSTICWQSTKCEHLFWGALYQTKRKSQENMQPVKWIVKNFNSACLLAVSVETRLVPCVQGRSWDVLLHQVTSWVLPKDPSSLLAGLSQLSISGGLGKPIIYFPALKILFSGQVSGILSPARGPAVTPSLPIAEQGSSSSCPPIPNGPTPH